MKPSRDLRKMSQHVWIRPGVLASPSTPAVDRCVDVFVRPDGSFGFEEFRRDPEDMGVWTPVAYFSTRGFATEADALSAAREAVPWLPEVLDRGT